MRTPRVDALLLDAQTARKAAELAAAAVDLVVDELGPREAATIAEQLRRTIRPALLTAHRLDRLAAELRRQETSHA